MTDVEIPKQAAPKRTIAQRPVRRKHYERRRYEIVWRKLGLWRWYGNTLNPMLNRRYRIYADKCRAAYFKASGSVLNLSQSSLRLQRVRKIAGVLPQQTALRFSEMFSRMIEAGIGAHSLKGLDYVYACPRPLDAFGKELLSIFSGDLDRELIGYFGGYYRIEWLDCYRSLPTEQPRAAWLWHMDNVPVECMKVILHLTHADAQTGATQVLSAEDTQRLHGLGYFGIYGDERKTEIQGTPLSLSMDPGDALCIDNNLLHRAVPPKRNYRDVLTFLILPNRCTWHEQLERDGLDSVQSDPGGFPRHPEQVIVPPFRS
jgi:hypothetical protein